MIITFITFLFDYVKYLSIKQNYSLPYILGKIWIEPWAGHGLVHTVNSGEYDSCNR